MKNLLYYLFILILIVPLKQSKANIGNLLNISDSLVLNYSAATQPIDKLNAIEALAEYHINKDNAKGIVYANEGLQLSVANNQVEFQIKFNLLLARFEMDKGNYLASINRIEQAINLNENIISKELTADIYSSRALFYIYIQETDKAAEFAYKALNLYSELGNPEGQSNALNFIASMYSEQGNYTKSLEYSLKSLKLRKQSSDTIGVAGALSNIGSNHINLKNYKEAISYTQKAIVLNKKNNQKNWLAVNYHQLALIYSRLEDYNTSNEYIQKCLHLYDELNNTSYANTSKLLLAYNYEKENQLDSAENIYNEVIKNSRKMGIINQLPSANLGLYKIYKQKGLYKDALDYYTMFQKTNDSLKARESKNRLISLETQYLLEQKKNELELEKQKSKTKAQRKIFYMAILSISLLAALISFVFIVLRYKMKIRYSKVKQQKLEDEIEFKNKELTSNVMSLMKKNEMLGEVTNKLIEVEKQAVKEETKTALQRIAKDIEKSTQEKIWEEFEIRFKQVHSEFYERLNRNYPDLSPNEQRLCAFLRLNLSSKEIAALTNKNTRSVEMARFRLRKKLGISSQDINLISFISSI